MPLSNLEVYWVVQELQPLIGTYFNKISDLENGWKLKFRNHEVLAQVPERIHLTQRKHNAVAPHGFTQYCRKHLHGRVTRVWQPGFDRVVAIDFDTGQRIVFEFFSRGNTILVDSDGNTEKTLRGEEWKDRVLKRGKPYSFPASDKMDPREMTEKEFNELFKDKDVIHSLVAGIKMSGKYLELACHRAGLDKNAGKPNKKLFKEIKKMLEEYKPGIQKTPVVQQFPGEDFVPKESFSEALDEFFSTIEADTSSSDKVLRKLKRQEKAINEMEEKAEKNREKGDLIYSKWQELSELMENIKEWRDKGMNYDEINKKLAGKAVINKKTRKMTVKL